MSVRSVQEIVPVCTNGLDQIFIEFATRDGADGPPGSTSASTTEADTDLLE